MNQEAARHQLAEMQATLLRALRMSSDYPTGFDTKRLAIASEILLRKRSQAVSLTLPMLRDALGNRYSKLFRQHAKKNPFILGGSPLADGIELAESIEPIELLSDDTWMEILGCLLRTTWKNDRLVLRRGVNIVYRVIRQRKRVVIGIRAFRMESWFSIPYLKFVAHA
jgi:hypothetical protein